MTNKLYKRVIWISSLIGLILSGIFFALSMIISFSLVDNLSNIVGNPVIASVYSLSTAYVIFVAFIHLLIVSLLVYFISKSKLPAIIAIVFAITQYILPVIFTSGALYKYFEPNSVGTGLHFLARFIFLAGFFCLVLYNLEEHDSKNVLK